MRWPMRPIGELATFHGGGTPSRSKAEFYDGDVPWVTPKDMKRWRIRDSQVRLTAAGVAASPAKILPAGSVLVVVRSGVLKHSLPVGIADVPVSVNQDLKALVARPGVEARYLAHLVKASDRVVLSWVRATTADNFPVEKLKELAIPLPPIEEQRRIADILDRADALRAKRREALALLDDLSQSIFREMFRDRDWPRTQLRMLATKITKGTTPTSVGLTFEESGVPFLRVMDLVGGLAVPSDRTLHISEVSHEVLARSKILGGEVLISIAGTIGRVATVPAGLPEMNCNQAVAIVSVGNQVELDYLAAWLRGTDAGRQMGSGSVKATIANLSLKEVGDLQVPFPPQDLQREFSARVSVLAQNRLSYEVLVAVQEALFASLQVQAFAGLL